MFATREQASRAGENAGGAGPIGMDVFRAAFETAAHGMALVSLDGAWLEVNNAVCDLLGYSRVELSELTFQDVTHPEDLESDLELLRSTLRGERQSYQLEKRYIRKDGAIVWILLSVALIRDEGGAPQFFVSQILDLTERRQAEEQLRHAQKMEAVGQLTGGIAHDFNNLLTVVIGNLEMLERGRLAEADSAPDRDAGTDTSSRRVGAALEAARRGARLTGRLLAFARKQPLDPKPVDVNDLVTGLGPLLARTVGEGVDLRYDLQAGLWHTVADPVQLENALLNLVINARDATQGRGAVLGLRTHNRCVWPSSSEPAERGVPPGEYVVATVTDNGTGMSAEVVRKASEPFFTTKGAGRGTGLGLSMVAGFVDQSGGHLTIRSAAGRGTEVRIYLPRCSAPVVPDAAPTLAAPGSDRGAGERILLVEDDRSIRTMSAEFLRGLGYEVIEAQDGRDALACQRRSSEPFDLLLTDVSMPGGINGRELGDRMRMHEPHIPILLCSGHAEASLIERSGLPPSCGFLAKPYSLSELATGVHEALSSGVGLNKDREPSS